MSKGFTDASGAAHPAAGDGARIVCLVPSITELLCDLGLTTALVGRTGFCIHPREIVRAIPKVGGTKDVDLNKVRALKPTHVIVNVDENKRETAAALAEFIPHVIVTHPLAPIDNYGLYRLLGDIFGVMPQAQRLCAALDEVLALIAAHGPRPPRKVLYLIWREPWMTVGRDTYISRTLAHFNWCTQPGDREERYPVIDLREVATRVDEVLLSTEPFPFQTRHVLEAQTLCGGIPVRLIDGEMTSWYGSRAIAGLRYLHAFSRAHAPVAA